MKISLLVKQAKILRVFWYSCLTVQSGEVQSIEVYDPARPCSPKLLILLVSLSYYCCSPQQFSSYWQKWVTLCASNFLLSVFGLIGSDATAQTTVSVTMNILLAVNIYKCSTSNTTVPHVSHQCICHVVLHCVQKKTPTHIFFYISMNYLWI